MPHNPTFHTFVFNDRCIGIFIPDSSPVKDAYEKGGVELLSPYWARLWPAAIGLCYFLQDHIHYIKDKKVLELAAGLGLPGIFCATYASQVCISDIAPQAVAMMQLSVKHQKIENISCRVIDWNDVEELSIPDTLLLSDINYEPEQFEKLLALIRHFLSNHCTIILSTPQRLMAKDFIQQLLGYCKEQATIPVDWEGRQTDVSVFVLKE